MIRRLIGVAASFGVVALAGVTLAAGAAQATTTDSCLDFTGPLGSPGTNTCFTGTQSPFVELATVQMGRHSFGSWALVCTDWGGQRVAFRQGRIGVAGVRNLSPASLFGFFRPSCVLTAQAISARPGQNAHARVSLVT